EYTPSARAGEIMALYLLRDFQDRGLGFQLMKAAMEELNKMPQIILWVLEGNERAIRFYESLGFCFDGARRSEAYGTELRMIWAR
ncbi:MAG TPA: GNAT family N-acetyltransferase, partial [Clostridiaceae bacterium]|nr:GNAT family N-acetyltransferase [Clostridiaceae bacterium]